MSDRKWPDHPFPDGELYLIKSDHQWMIYASQQVGLAIRIANERDAARIWRVTAIEVEELAVQREIIRETLVPRGSEVTS